MVILSIRSFAAKCCTTPPNPPTPNPTQLRRSSPTHTSSAPLPPPDCLLSRTMGKLIKNHLARLIILTAALYQVAAGIHGIFWPKVFWDVFTT